MTHMTKVCECCDEEVLKEEVTIVDEGTIVLFIGGPCLDDWWEENCQETLRFGEQYAVEHRYAMDIAFAIQEEGFQLVSADGTKLTLERV